MQCLLFLFYGFFFFTMPKVFSSGAHIVEIANNSSLPITFKAFISDVHDYPDMQFYKKLDTCLLKKVLNPGKTYKLERPLFFNKEQLFLDVPAAGISARVHQMQLRKDEEVSEDMLLVTSSHIHGQIIPIEKNEELDLESDCFLTIKNKKKIIKFDQNENNENEATFLSLQKKGQLYRFYAPEVEGAFFGEKAFYYTEDNLGRVLCIYDPQSGQEEIQFH